MRQRVRRTAGPKPARVRGRLCARVGILSAAAAAAWVGAGGALHAGVNNVRSTWRGGTGNWGSPENWDNFPAVVQFPNNGNGGFTYDAVVNSGIVTLDQVITIERFTMTGGLIDGPGNLNLKGPFAWSGGVLSGSGVTNANGGVSFTNPFGNQSLRRTLNLPAGTASTLGAGGGLDIGAGGVLNNFGTLDVTADVSLFSGGAGSAFNNSGTFAKTAGAGTTAIGAGLAFTNTGTVRVDTGTLALDASATHTGSFIVAPGAT